MAHPSLRLARLLLAPVSSFLDAGFDIDMSYSIAVAHTIVSYEYHASQ